MGLYDSLFVECPNCKNVLEFQSKSGMRCMSEFNMSNLPSIVAFGMNGDIIKCDKCKKNFELKCEIPEKPTKIEVKQTRKKAHYIN